MDQSKNNAMTLGHSPGHFWKLRCAEETLSQWTVKVFHDPDLEPVHHAWDVRLCRGNSIVDYSFRAKTKESAMAVVFVMLDALTAGIVLGYGQEPMLMIELVKTAVREMEINQ